ncbi:unnamed protein product [Closterium sp. Naga37s-1]|nr:unnamed protein product [Closterium sp. Naga37s-1]
MATVVGTGGVCDCQCEQRCESVCKRGGPAGSGRVRMWFEEEIEENLRWVFGVTNILHTGVSEFQDIELLESGPFGKQVLVLDGKLQSAEADEFVYHESLVHPALLYHPQPKRVFIMGGGEGSTARECLKHSSVEMLEMCDIDKRHPRTLQLPFPFSSSLNPLLPSHPPPTPLPSPSLFSPLPPFPSSLRTRSFLATRELAALPVHPRLVLIFPLFTFPARSPARSPARAEPWQEVVEFCRRHLTINRDTFASPRLKLIINDALEELQSRTAEEGYDVIIGDLADPVDGGPCYKLYTKSFYTSLLKPRLNPGGILVTQAGPAGILSAREVYTPIYNTLRQVFKYVVPYAAHVPSYADTWGWIMASDTPFPEMAAADVDARIQQRVDGELRFLDGSTMLAVASLNKHLRNQCAMETTVYTEDSPLFIHALEFRLCSMSMLE